ncbi:MAG: TadE/TadG family type IV pilus assembly protein, partial [bacterium]
TNNVIYYPLPLNYTNSAIKSKRGQALVETAVILPLLIFIILGVLEIIHLYNTKRLVEYAAFCVARQEIMEGIEEVSPALKFKSLFAEKNTALQADKRKIAAALPLLGVSFKRLYEGAVDQKENRLYHLLKDASPLTPGRPLSFNKPGLFKNRLYDTMERTSIKILENNTNGVKVQVLYLYAPLFFSLSGSTLFGDRNFIAGICAFVNGLTTSQQKIIIQRNFNIKSESFISKIFPVMGQCYLRRI